MKPTIFAPGQKQLWATPAEIWTYRELFLVFAVRDIKVRYRQTFLGVAWAILQPLATMLVLWFVFGRVAGISSQGYPYPIFVFAALLPWALFANCVVGAGNSLIASASLVTKTNFPRLLIPLSACAVYLLDFAVSSTALGLMIWYYDIELTARILLAPVAMLGVLMLVAGLGSLLAAITVLYRDFRFVVPFAMQVWFFGTPIIYPVEMLPEDRRWLLLFNPMSGCIEGFRAAILGGPLDFFSLAVSELIAVATCVGGIYFFMRIERRLADVI